MCETFSRLDSIIERDLKTLIYLSIKNCLNVLVLILKKIFFLYKVYRKIFSCNDDDFGTRLPSNPNLSSVEEKIKHVHVSRNGIPVGDRKKNVKKLGSAIRWIPNALRNGPRSELRDSPARDAVGQYTGPVECERFALLLRSDTSRYSVPSGGRGRGMAVSSQRRLPPCGLLTPKSMWQRTAATNWSNNKCSTVPYNTIIIITTTITSIVIATVILR